MISVRFSFHTILKGDTAQRLTDQQIPVRERDGNWLAEAAVMGNSSHLLPDRKTVVKHGIFARKALLFQKLLPVDAF